MADAVETALEQDRILICEAGTGTGKTLAYLLPAIRSGRKVIVSTATRALQEQIFGKDLPLIRRTLGLDVRAALMKGLGNYLCLRRYGEFRASPEAEAVGAGRRLAVLEQWASATNSGDLAEIEGLVQDDTLFAEVCSSSDTRIGGACEHYDECFVTRMKAEADAAQIVIVNHHLFFSDLALRGPHAGGALPDYDAVIFDEAHQLEDIATDFFGVRVSTARLAALLRDADRAFVSSGLTDPRTRRCEGTAIADVAREAATRFFAEITHLAGGGDGKATLAPDVWNGELLRAYHRLDAAAEALAAYAKLHAGSEGIEIAAKRAEQLRVDLAAIVDGAKNQVTWAEARLRSVAVGASPVDLAGLFKERLFSRVPAVVLTSATLTTHSGFGFLRSRLGLEGDDLDVTELAVPSPFDFASRALLYVPRDLPDPGDPAWIGAAGLRIRELVEASDGGAFVLATSRRVMTALAEILRQDTTRPVLVQGQAPKSALLDRFREAENAVLVATMSFWEGVDVPGRALRLVVLDKIPFLVPSDPIVVARGAALEASGKNPFSSYQVPSAALLLKQGFGRLIRTRKDAGVVAILDPRIHARSYGRTLMASLPPARRCTEQGEAVRFAKHVARAGEPPPDDQPR
jgi:ATP-dependent DNA helicase DinG